MANTNPFDLMQQSASTTKSRRLDYTPQLIDCANQRALHIMKTGTEHAELAKRVITDGNTADLLELISKSFDEAAIKADAQILDGCDSDQLSRLLESRRSDRSKSKKLGIGSSALNCRNYISAMYAELLIREKMGKPYTGQSSATDYDVDKLAADQAALVRKIKSLQSKKCRLNKLAAYDPTAASELSEVTAEIDRLNSLRTSGRVRTTSIIKDFQIDELRAILDRIDPNTLTETERHNYDMIKAKLG